MGSVMFSMAMLAPPEPGDPFFREREALPDASTASSLSQIGPVVVFTPDNVFRAYLMSYLRAFLPLANYEFRIGPAPSLTDQLIDRVLASMPYPEREFDIENPWWPPWRRTPWVGSRHRMDALYGRDFNVENVSPEGPRRDRRPVRAAVDRDGRRRRSISRASALSPTTRVATCSLRVATSSSAGSGIRRLSIHGKENGLYDVATLSRMNKLFNEDLGIDFTTHEFPGIGHQDSLIGKRTGEVFAGVEEFLNGRDPR